MLGTQVLSELKKLLEHREIGSICLYRCFSTYDGVMFLVFILAILIGV